MTEIFYQSMRLDGIMTKGDTLKRMNNTSRKKEVTIISWTNGQETESQASRGIIDRSALHDD